MLKISPYLIVTSVLSFIIWYLNYDSVRYGPEMGAGLIEFFESLRGTIAILITYGFVSFKAENLKGNLQDEIQVLLILVCSVVVYFYTWSTCHKNITPTAEEKIVELVFFTKKIPDILRNGDIYKPSNYTLWKEKELVKVEFLNLARQAQDTMELEARKRYSSLKNLYFPKGFVDERRTLDKFCESVDVWNMFYSPDKSKVVVFIAFDNWYTENDEERKMGSVLMLVGKREMKKILLYKVEIYSDKIYRNKEMACAAIFKDYCRLGSRSMECFSLMEMKFWECNILFGRVSATNSPVYNFQVYTKYNDRKLTKRIPDLVVNL